MLGGLLPIRMPACPRAASTNSTLWIFTCASMAIRCRITINLRNGKKVELDNDLPEEFRADVDGLIEHLRKEFTGDERGLTYDNVRLRASKVTTAGGELWVAMRRINDQPPPLDKLGFDARLVPFLRKLGERDGLILLCGATGNGKTTTSCSMLADFLNTYGGVAFSIEDPVEYDLEGRRGKHGFCYQIEIEEEGEWGEMLKRSLRWHPRYIFVGEIRTPDAANQLLRAATSGHLVITTMHAGSIEEALEGMLQLAEQAIGDRAPLLLAAGLTAIIHQTADADWAPSPFPYHRAPIISGRAYPLGHTR